jgi:hypothetical protein
MESLIQQITAINTTSIDVHSSAVFKLTGLWTFNPDTASWEWNTERITELGEVKAKQLLQDINELK